MKIVVIGGTGLIGSKLVKLLRAQGHDVVAASPNTGVNAVTGEGLTDALAGAHTVVDVANSPSFEDQAVLAFFQTSGRKLLAAAAAAGVAHHVALSVVGTERLQDSGYFRGKWAQEQLIEAARVPYTIVRATQFFEFMGSIAQAATADAAVQPSAAAMQPMSSDDVATALARVVSDAPLNGRLEIAGPERRPMAEFVQRYLAAIGDARHVVADAHAPYFGVVLDETSLVPSDGARLGATRFDAWLTTQRKAV